MKIVFVSAACVSAALAFTVGTATGRNAPAASAVSSAPASRITARGIATPELTTALRRYCVSCHGMNLETRKGNLTLSNFNIDSAPENLEVSEKIIRRLRADMMPPPGSRRPAGDTLIAIAEALEQIIDKAAGKPNPGTRTFQRLNRPEYEAAVRDLLGLEINAGDYLPLDTKSANFDNIADVQSLSPTLLESYLNAAAAVSRAAVGDRKAPTTLVMYKSSPFGSQHPWDHVEGAPYGTRGGIVTQHVFPADAEYTFRINVSGGTGTRLEDVDVSIDGERVALLHYERGIGRNDGSADAPNGADYIRTEPIKIKAGQHKVAAAFVRRTEGPYEDLIKPHDWSRASNGTASAGSTEPPHVLEIGIAGPNNITGISETPSRKIIFSCRPTGAAPQRACAEQILGRLGMRAYRRPLTAHDKKSLMTFYDATAPKEGFEEGVRASLQAMLSSPYFVFRFESAPRNVAPGTDYKISDIDLASRLSFFLWGTIPDQQLLTLAQQKRLSQPAALEREVKRMLADPKAEALSTRFAAQWLRLQDLDKVHPDAFLFPDFDLQLADAMRKETMLFFDELVREDKSILEMYTADFTYVNGKLAKHYGIPNVTGEEFERVQYPDDTRRGILGHGSVLVQTSLANRTSPVLRGKWVMEVLIGMPPPPPPPGVPDLEETKEAKEGRQLTTRERMEEHRTNIQCKTCHVYMDPLGLALDNFDVTGKVRYRENAMPLDTKGDMYDGTKVSSAAELNQALLKRPIPLVRSFTENLMAYALGRRVEDYDQPTVRVISKNAAAKGYKMSSFVMGVVNSSAFRSKRADVVADDTDKGQR